MKRTDYLILLKQSKTYALDFVENIIWKIEKNINLLKKIKAWAPIVLKDQDWDFAFFLDIVAFKVKRMRLHFERSDISMSNRTCATQIEFAERLLYNIINEGTGDCVYTKKFEKLNPNSNSYHDEITFVTKSKEEDLEALIRFIGANYRGWWD